MIIKKLINKEKHIIDLINVISIRTQIAEIIIILLIVNYYIGTFIIYSKQINKQDIG